MQGLIKLQYSRSLMHVEDRKDRKVPLRTIIFVACVSGAVAMEVLNLPARFAFAAVFAALMSVCPDIWVDLPKSQHEELEDVRREIASLKLANAALKQAKVTIEN